MSNNLTMSQTSPLRFSLSHRFIFLVNSTVKITSSTNDCTSNICDREKPLNNNWLIDTHSRRQWSQMLFLLIFKRFVNIHHHNYRKLAICWHSKRWTQKWSRKLQFLKSIGCMLSMLVWNIMKVQFNCHSYIVK